MIFSKAAQGGYLLLCGGVGGLLSELHFVKVRVGKIAKKRVAQYREFADPVTYRWDKQTLSGKSATATGSRPWNYYVLRKENDAVILLYMTDGLFQIVPKRWFADERQLDEFREYAKVIRG